MKKKIIIILIIIVLLPIFINYIVIFSTSNRIVNIDDDNLNDIDYIVVLGASVKRGGPSPMLEDRLKKAIYIYNNVSNYKILVSGDHSTDTYDEVTIMRDYLVDNGIPIDNIVMDHLGVSTYDSMFRVKSEFKANKVIVVSQKYHLYRALFIANSFSLDAYGVAADDIVYRGQLYREIREILARNKDFVKSIIKPTFYYQRDIIN